MEMHKIVCVYIYKHISIHSHTATGKYEMRISHLYKILVQYNAGLSLEYRRACTVSMYAGTGSLMRRTRTVRTQWQPLERFHLPQSSSSSLSC